MPKSEKMQEKFSMKYEKNKTRVRKMSSHKREEEERPSHFSQSRFSCNYARFLSRSSYGELVLFKDRSQVKIP